LVPYHSYMFICLDYVKLVQVLEATMAFGTLLIIGLNVLMYGLRMYLKEHSGKKEK